jgi:hypothetical protein
MIIFHIFADKISQHMKYEKVKKNLPQMVSLTGFTVSKLEVLLLFFKQE